jgi:glutamate synthase (NADPH/NADH) large chain
MTQYDENWVAAEEAKRQWMAENSLYRTEDEHASCGVGLVVSIDGNPAAKWWKTGSQR